MIYNADAIDYMRNMPDNSVGCVVTSPPYNIGVKYDVYVDNNANYIDWTLSWLSEAMRISHLGVMLNIGSKASDRNQLYKLLGAIANEHVVQNEIVWCKSIFVDGRTYGHFKPINSAKYVNNTHELILHIVNNPTPIRKLSIGVPFEYKSNIDRFTSNNGDLRCRGSTWFLPYETRNEQLKHPATFPAELAEMMIKYTGAGSVHDPFAGSGSVGVACKKLGLPFTGTEISADYTDSANNRINSYNVFEGLGL